MKYPINFNIGKAEEFYNFCKSQDYTQRGVLPFADICRKIVEKPLSKREFDDFIKNIYWSYFLYCKKTFECGAIKINRDLDSGVNKLSYDETDNCFRLDMEKIKEGTVLSRNEDNYYFLFVHEIMHAIFFCATGKEAKFFTEYEEEDQAALENQVNIAAAAFINLILQDFGNEQSEKQKQLCENP